MPNLNCPSYSLITTNFLFFLLNLNLSPNNVTGNFVSLQNLPYNATHDIFGVSLEKSALFLLYLQVLYLMVCREQILLKQLSCLLNIFLLSSPTILALSFRLHPSQYILFATSPSHLMPIFFISNVYQGVCSFCNMKLVGPDGIQGDFLYKFCSVLAEPL